MKALLHIKESLRKEGNPLRVPQMEAYMRNQFPFYGVMSTPRKEILKTLKKDQLDVLDTTEKRTLIQLLWEEEHRECQLVALEWLMTWKPNEFIASDIELFEWLITSKSWWDTVDGIAPNVFVVRHFIGDGTPIVSGRRFRRRRFSVEKPPRELSFQHGRSHLWRRRRLRRSY